MLQATEYHYMESQLEGIQFCIYNGNVLRWHKSPIANLYQNIFDYQFKDRFETMAKF